MEFLTLRSHSECSASLCAAVTLRDHLVTLEVFAVPYLPQSEPPNSFRLQVCLVEIVSSLLKGQLDPSRLSDASIRFPMHPDHYKVSH